MYYQSYFQVFRTIALSSLLVCSLLTLNAQQTDKKLEKILSKSKELRPVLSQKDKYEIQIIYTQIDRDAQNRPTFTTYNFNVDPKRYFYPASTIKLPAVLLSLEKINKLKINGFTKETGKLLTVTNPFRLIPLPKTETPPLHITPRKYS
ncbi:MAG: hypothetical protein NWP83_07715 [Spirosomaceae bacterium]|nr:hypothetical protein [Spirosomataceae bacterium]